MNTEQPPSFRDVLGHFASGVTVVTGTGEDGPVGFTCQSFSSLSLEPPQIIILPGRSSTTWPRIAAAWPVLRQYPRRPSGRHQHDVRDVGHRQVRRCRMDTVPVGAAAAGRDVRVARLHGRRGPPRRGSPHRRRRGGRSRGGAARPPPVVPSRPLRGYDRVAAAGRAMTSCVRCPTVRPCRRVGRGCPRSRP